MVWGALLLVTGLFALSAFFTARHFVNPHPVAELRAQYQNRLHEVAEERVALQQATQRFQETRAKMESALHALGRRVGTMQARVMRLDSLGERVVQVADLEGGEFDFSQSPALGGPDAAQGRPSAENSGSKDLVALARQVEKLSARVSDREEQLQLLRGMIDRQAIRQRMRPEGWPTEGGWLSSNYGRRIDPFSGEPAFHEGVDVANDKGAAVEAIAPGVVVWAGERTGYGRMVAIDHGNGYRTRYAHCAAVTVDVGTRVAKGDKIAKVGETGRSTGPHIHLEVLRDGEQIDPRKFVER